MIQSQDTICALATANGVGAVAMIRVSGSNAIEIVNQHFSKNLNHQQSHTLHFGLFKDDQNQLLDEVLIALFHQGKSFTGEESVEISTHGSNFIVQQVLQSLVKSGCRMAKPGEFTMRAYMNGKLDLSQAEAVADLIASESKKSHEIALNQLRGRFSNELKNLREELIHFASLVELELDFAEEDVEFADRSELLQLVTKVMLYLKKLIRSFELGNALKNGVPVAIIGAPNTGKSTLLNQLLGEDRAIVSNIAGTTRDVIEETLNIGGIIFRLIDTAGIRENAEEIEAIGIEKSHEKLSQAQIVLLLSDFSQNNSASEGHASMNTNETGQWAESLLEQYPNKKFVVLANKMDLRQADTPVNWNYKVPMLVLSAKTGEGIAALEDWMVEQITQGIDVSQDTIISNMRHLEALQKANDALEQAKFGLETKITGDFVAMDIRQAMFHLGSITGDISTDDLLGNIFSKFCIGK
jgi:tRNA modification GTPase